MLMVHVLLKIDKEIGRVLGAKQSKIFRPRFYLCANINLHVTMLQKQDNLQAFRAGIITLLPFFMLVLTVRFACPYHKML